MSSNRFLTCRDGHLEPEETFEVLNEVVLSRGANPYLSKIEASNARVAAGQAACDCSAP